MINTVAWTLAGLWLLLLARLLNSGTRYDPVHVVRFIAWGWAVMFFASAAQLIEFPAVSWEPWLYIAAFPSVQMIGAAVIGRRHIRSPRKDKGGQSQGINGYRQTQSLTQTIVVLGFFAVLFDLYLQFGVRGFDPSAADLIRDVEYQTQSISELGWIGQITLITNPLAWTGLILTFVFVEKLGIWHKRLGALIAIGIVLLGVASAGRTIHMRLGLVVLAAILVRRGMGLHAWPWRWNMPLRVLTIAVAGIAAWYFGFVWAWRAGGLDSFYMTASRFHIDAQESSLLLWLLRGAPDSVRSVVVSLLWYIGTMMDNFASFYARVEYPPMWGLWEVGLANFFARLGLSTKDSWAQTLDVAAAYAVRGLSVGQWRTMAQGFILDFGRGGALVASALYGAVIGFFYRKFRKSSPGKPHWAPIYVLLLTWTLYGAWSSPISLPQLILVMYLIVYGVACDSICAERRSVPIVKADLQNKSARSLR